MTHLHLDPQFRSIHPLEVIDQLDAGYVLDIVRKFRSFFAWPLDQESLCGLLTLAARHFPALHIGGYGNKLHPSYESLIWRLQIRGDLAYDEQGFRLTDKGEKRCNSTFKAALVAPLWGEAVEQIKEDLMIFSETEGVLLAIA